MQDRVESVGFVLTLLCALDQSILSLCFQRRRDNALLEHQWKVKATDQLGYFLDHGNIDYFEPSRLFSTLKNFGIKKILYAGDSLTAQILEHFICDMSRLEYVVINYKNGFISTVTVNGIQFPSKELNSNFSDYLGHNQQINLVEKDLHGFADKLFLEILVSYLSKTYFFKRKTYLEFICTKHKA